ncbi:ABC transporter ATP-binding protein [Streptomyces sp. TRM 70361]|uniref:ABC transporter ATP-binding protein n=1 Tax=Streptomyces sp. TRM 70361 TaxID=3116553 RepID=UPI002E7BF235|nr:ABC transporter ATP-binding protein [Streptomyces sp. TRM 70361]MEE1938331.1 ABC transporter ATP-binding protein [Streptomyces sp. TRM 70361]
MNISAIVRRHRLLLAVGTLLGLAGTAATLLQPLLIGDLIEAVALDEPVTRPIVLIAALFAADALLAATHFYLIGRAGENIVLDMRTTLTGRLLHSRIRAFNRLEHGDVFTRTVADTAIARIALSSSVAQMITAGFTTVGCVAVMAWLDWRMLLVTVGCLGTASAVALALARAVRRAAVTNREDTSAYGSGLLRVLGALTTVKASRAETREAERLRELADAARGSGIRVTRLSAMLMPAMNVGTQVSLAVVIAWGMARTATGSLSLEDLTAFIMYLFYLVSPLVMLFMALGEFQQGRAAIDRVRELAAVEQETTDGGEGTGGDTPGRPAGSAAAATAPGTAAVEFDDVTFGYPDTSAPAVAGVSFSLPATGVTAIVGPSGAGKTTLFQLIERFQDPDRGTVRVLGADVTALPLDELRARVALVEQEAPLMRGTVRENLTYARPDATAGEIREAVEAAHFAEVVDALPGGLDTELGENGIGLSGGQRQRLAIARALLARPDVLLLDEATSNLDSDSETALRAAIATVGARCQVLTIAHRISTVVDADRILVLEDGRLRAAGTHADLMASDDTYRRLAGQQLAPVAANPETEPRPETRPEPEEGAGQRLAPAEAAR